jgi:hypothetical protein
MKNSLFFLLFFSFLLSCQTEKKAEVTDVPQVTTQPQTITADTTTYCKDTYFNSAYKEIHAMLEGKSKPDFKRSAFLIEWAYNQGKLDYTVFCGQIANIAFDLKTFIKERGVEKYKTSGNFALFEYFTKPHKMNNNKPYSYNFDDFYGKKNMNSVFVSGLLQTHKGQCRSMPMLYKILSEEIGAESYLAMGPNHMYIKHLDEQGKWVNIELTNGHFSSDAWMISSLEISAEAIKKGVFMKELTIQESISRCLEDLGTVYSRKYDYDDFTLKCYDETLKYYPTSITALMGKYNVLRTQGLAYMKKNGKGRTQWLVNLHDRFKEVSDKIDFLGYRDMTPEAYRQWIDDMAKEKAKLQAQN